MGTPSGSKNQTVFMDALDLREARDFEKGAVDDSHLRADDFSNEPAVMREEKRQRRMELLEFRTAKIATAKPARKLLPKTTMPEGPSAQKRPLPSFVKLKSKDSSEALGIDLEPLEKRVRTDVGCASPEENSTAEDEAPSSQPVPVSAASPLGVGLANYDSDSEDDED